MFAPLGLFKGISCPKGFDCQLLNCIFSHDYIGKGSTTTDGNPAFHNGNDGEEAAIGNRVSSTKNGSAATDIDMGTTPLVGPKIPRMDKQYDPLTAGMPSPPPLKKRRLDPEIESTRQESRLNLSPAAKSTGSVSSGVTARTSLSKLASSQTEQLSKPATVKSVRRPISPPAIRGSKINPPTSSTDHSKNKLLPAETLNPRMVTKAPESHKNRLTLVKMLHQLMEGLNRRIGDAAKDNAAWLTASELICLALDEEEHLARSQQEGMYRSAITGRITMLKKMQPDDWRKYVYEHFPDKDPVKASRQKIIPVSQSIITGLGSVQEEMEILRLLRTPLEGLEGYGYVTTPPSAKEIEDSRKGVQTAAGFEVCDRCGTNFQVFPGRDDQGRLTSHGSCQYHWAKYRKPVGQKTDRTTGQQDASYACCNRGAGSEGCTIAHSHIFKVTDPKRLASILQFKQTPQRARVDSKPSYAVAFDCEMGYTTLGLELIRVTTVSWPQNKELLDVLVRTQGEILDLNTRFSGVSAEAYTSAPSYNAERVVHGDDTSKEGELEPESLQKVESVAAARELMFDLLCPETPLIGHAIDNDLNACRMIHPFVADTVLLYPHPRGLPIRYGLKMLSSKHLERGIQMGGALGHDSKEDAVAAGDLVKIKVREEWQRRRLEGWVFESGRLVKPDGERVLG